MLEAEKFARLKGRKVGLVTNHTGRDRQGRATIDVLHAADGVKLVALFSPEHGIRGELDESNIADTTDAKTGLPVYSLYGKRRKPTPRPSRGSTPSSTTSRTSAAGSTRTSARSASSWRRRPSTRSRSSSSTGRTRSAASPSTGPLTDPGRESFVAYHALPIRHGMTVGELAKLFNAERKLTVESGRGQVRGLAARRPVRPDEPDLGEPVAEHARA